MPYSTFARRAIILFVHRPSTAVHSTCSGSNEEAGWWCYFCQPRASEERKSPQLPPLTTLFGETISIRLSSTGHRKVCPHRPYDSVPLIVDNAFPTPINCLNPFEWGRHRGTLYYQIHGWTYHQRRRLYRRQWQLRDWMPMPINSRTLHTRWVLPWIDLHYLFLVEMAYITKATAQLMRDLSGIQNNPPECFPVEFRTGNVASPHASALWQRTEKVAEYLSKETTKVAWVNIVVFGNKYWTGSEICRTVPAVLSLSDDWRRTQKYLSNLWIHCSGCYRDSCGRRPVHVYCILQVTHTVERWWRSWGSRCTRTWSASRWV